MLQALLVYQYIFAGQWSHPALVAPLLLTVLSVQVNAQVAEENGPPE